MSVRHGGHAHVHAHGVWLAERLSDRDWQVVEAVNRLRLMTGDQLERLCFAALTGHTRAVVRGRVLRRLVDWNVLTMLPRRIGGAARGSSVSAFALGTAGARLWAEGQAARARLWAEGQAARAPLQRVRHPGAPTERSIRHTLAVSELYVRLIEWTRTPDAKVSTFEAEPASWWPNGIGRFLKPDAYACLAQGNVRDHWWIEVDRATESLPTIKRKLLAYLDFVERGQLGPGNIVPRVLVSCTTEARCVAVRLVISKLPPPARELFVTLVDHEAAAYLSRSIRE